MKRNRKDVIIPTSLLLILDHSYAVFNYQTRLSDPVDSTGSMMMLPLLRRGTIWICMLNTMQLHALN